MLLRVHNGSQTRRCHGYVHTRTFLPQVAASSKSVRYSSYIVTRLCGGRGSPQTRRQTRRNFQGCRGRRANPLTPLQFSVPNFSLSLAIFIFGDHDSRHSPQCFSSKPSAMAARTRIESVSLLATIPHPLDPEQGRILLSTVSSFTKSKKRKRLEIAACIDGEAVNIYSVCCLYPIQLSHF